MKTSKQVVAYCLLMVMLLSHLGVVSPFILEVSAVDSISTTGFHSGTGIAADPYIISTKAELLYFAELLKQGVTFSGMYLSLSADIDISDSSWNVGETAFQGDFNGNGHTITMTSKFVYSIGENGRIFLLNIVVPESVTRSSEILCGTNNGTIEGCVVSGNIEGDDNYLGFMCRENKGTIANSATIGQMSGPNVYAAGFVYDNYGTLDNVYSAVTTKGVYSSGRYGSMKCDAIVVGISSGNIVNAYYCYDSSKYGTCVSSEIMQTREFANMLNETNARTQSSWSYNEGGFPIPTLDRKISASCQLEYSNEEIFTYNTTTLDTKILVSSYVDCDVYYTLDGSNPVESDTAIKYDGLPLQLTGSGIIRMVGCKDGVYSQICNQRYIQVRGDGTEQSPYLIGSKEELCAVYLNPDAHYLLECDLVFDESDFAPGGVCEGGWTPIESFGGVFDGDDHAIANLQGENGGFINTNSGTVSSLRFLNCQLCYGSAYSSYNRPNFGSIAGYNNGTITKCYVELKMSTYGLAVGGIAGSNSGTVSYCSTSGVLIAYGPAEHYYWSHVGGIAGENNYTSSSIYGCYNKADIEYRSGKTILSLVVGGICGKGNLSDCRSDCNVYVNVLHVYSDGGISQGAFVGDIYTATNCYGEYNYRGPDTSVGYREPFSPSKNLQCYSTMSSEDSWKESSYPQLDFADTWMIKNGAPVPQGCMDADGNCYTKLSYSEEATADGGFIGESKYVNQYGEIVIETYPHVCVSEDPACQDSTCIECGAEMPSTGNHTAAEAVVENRVEATCTDEGSYDSVVYCTFCDAELSRERVVITALGHNYEDGKCECGDEVFIPSIGGESLPSRVDEYGAVISEFKAGSNDNAPMITVTSPAGGWKLGEDNTFTVSNTTDIACVVIVKKADGSFEKLDATTEEKIHKFTISAEDLEHGEIIVAVKGDTNGDGKITMPDVARLNAAALGKITLGALNFFSVDFNDDGELKMPEVARLNAVALGKTSLSW